VRLPEPFRREGEHLAIDLPGARVLYTTRRGGVSTGPYESLNLGWTTGSAGGAPGDDHARVEANRERVAGLVGIPRERFAHGRQVHEATVRRRREPPDPAEMPPASADGQATDQATVAPVVLVADCLPVALAVPGAVAMLHCGWRGLAAGIVAEGVAALRELAEEGPATQIAAAIGPGVGRCCYEVGEEVHAAFADLGAGVRKGRNLDLKLVARRKLEAAGVGAVHDAELCTMCSDPELFFSHRRDGGVTGRQAGVVWRS
jgi:YfiH family protein